MESCNMWGQLLKFINIFVISSFVLNMSFWHLTYIRSNVYIIVFDFRKKCWWRWLRRLAQWLFVVNIWRHLPTLETGPHQHPTVLVLTENRPSQFFLFIYKITSALQNKVHIFWEGHKILWNLHQLFEWQYIEQIIGGDFAKFCSLPRIYEL